MPRDSPVVFEAVEDKGKYMKRCHDCLEVILGCGDRDWEKWFERRERCGCRMMLGL